MSTKTASKGGRLPIAAKNAPATDFNGFDEFNWMTLDKGLKAELAEQGLVPRWVGAKLYYDAGNMHPKGWRAYRRLGSQAIKENADFRLGQSADGFIIRNGMILAVKTTEEVAKHKKFIEMRKRAQSGLAAEKTEELREMTRGTGINVHDGYEDDGATRGGSYKSVEGDEE